jgi:hypothetical protein
MARRADLSERIAALVGDDVLRITDSGSGWPALGELSVEGVAVPVALFVGEVGLSHRGRDEVERRFQNPAQDRPIIPIPGRDLLLVGLWAVDEFEDVKRPLLVSADPSHRIGRTTRFSIFVSLTMLQAALENGWSEAESATGESIRCLVPPLLPVSYAADRGNAAPAVFAMEAAVDASGLLLADDAGIPAAAERARRAGTALVRDRRFSRRVVNAYGGGCAMCGLSVGLVQGAHIYPVAAPGSYDEVWNGLALCGNHHLAFDAHLVGVDVTTSEILLHPTVRQHVSSSPAVDAFVSGTFATLAVPVDPADAPKPEMFEMRYEHFVDRYSWLR